MAITATKFDNFLLGQMSGVVNGVVDFDTDTIKVALFKSGVTAVLAAATNDFYDDLVAASWECTGTNYTAGGATLTATCTLNTGTVKFDADDVTWAQSASGLADARYAVIYKYNATPANARLICYINFGADIGNTIADLVLVWNTAGIVTWA